MFDERLKLLRSERNLTQAEFAQRIGVSARVAGYYETENRFPKHEHLMIAIADLFSVSVDWLLGRTDIRPMVQQDKNLLIIDCTDFTDVEKSKINDYVDLLRISQSTR